MKLEMTTTWMPLIDPGLYGTRLGDMMDSIDETYIDEFKKEICDIAIDLLNEIVQENPKIFWENTTSVSNAELKSPRFYNYENDSIEFDLEIDCRSSFLIFGECSTPEFFKWIEKNFGSRPGFISFFPYRREDFEKAIRNYENSKGNYDYNRAFGMAVTYLLRDDLDEFQREFEARVENAIECNGWDLPDFEITKEQIIEELANKIEYASEYKDYIESNIFESIEVAKNKGNIWDLDGIIHLENLLNSHISYEFYHYVNENTDDSIMDFTKEDVPRLMMFLATYAGIV